MKIGIFLEDIGDGKVTVTECTDGDQYLPEGSTLTARNRFEWLDTASVDVFRLNATTGDTFTSPVITLRSDSDHAEIQLDRDGWFTAIHMVIPTQDWVYRELSKSGSIINTYDIVYYTDGQRLYTCIGGKLAVAQLQDLLDETGDGTTISRVDADYVSIAQLQQDCDDAYTTILRDRLYNGGCDIDACEANRLVAALNLVRHYVRWGQLAEAERIIEKMNGLSVGSTDKMKNKPHDCGCL